MKIGLLRTLLFYGIGFGLAGLSYLIVGHPYMHAPGLHHIIILLTLIIGVIWFLASVVKFLKTKAPTLKGVVYSNLIVILCFVIYIAYLINFT